MDLLEVVRSLRRSNLRRRGMRRMEERRRSYPALLAEDLDVSLRDLNRMLDGQRPHYAPELSPIRLGLLKRERRGRRVELVITPLGERVVREMGGFVGRR